MWLISDLLGNNKTQRQISFEIKAIAFFYIGLPVKLQSIENTPTQQNTSGFEGSDISSHIIKFLFFSFDINSSTMRQNSDHYGYGYL